MSGFVIKYQDINDILWEYKDYLETLIDNITTAQKCVGNFINVAEFTGETADAIRSYLNDVHMTLLSSLQTAAQSLLDNIAVYKAGYYEIDGSTNFVLSEEVMEAFRAKLVSRYNATEICGDQIENVLVSISDLFTTSNPDKNQVPETHEQMDYDIIQLKESITNHESMMVQAVENSIEPLINLLESSINKAGSNTTDVGDYESGKFFANTDVDMLMKLSQYLDVQHENNKEIYDEIWDAEKQIKAEQEENDGIWETIAGVGLVIAGGICIVATAGAATPIVVAGGIAGGGTMLFGMSDTTEGIQHIYYGKTGDVSSIAMNPLRDSVFNGKERAYRITENVFEFSSSVLPIAGMASKAGKTAFSAGAKGVRSAEGKSIREIAKGGNYSKDTYDGVKQASEYLKKQGVPRQYRKQILESFDVRTIKLKIAGEKTYGLRFYGGNASAEGRYLFETFSPLTNRINLALPYEWNSMTGIQQFQVRKGTIIITGAAAPQSSFGAQYIGGASQWYINSLEDLIKCH